MPDLKWLAESSIEHLRLVLEVGNIGIWELDIPTGKAWRNRQHDAIFGYGPDALQHWTYERFLAHVVDADRERVSKLQDDAIAQGKPWVFECRIHRADGNERWINAVGRPLVGPDGEVEKLIGHVIDITDTKQNEVRLGLVSGELRHRVRNMLALIRAMINLSSKRATSVADFAKTLEGRVGALARSHILQIGSNDRRVDLFTIIEDEIAAFVELRQRFDFISRERPALPGTKAESVSMVIHELLTNAIKYGALSNDQGRIEVDISQDGEAIRLDWREAGGPPLSLPVSPGFGSRMMTSMLGSAGKVELDFRPEGLSCRMTLAA